MCVPCLHLCVSFCFFFPFHSRSLFLSVYVFFCVYMCVCVSMFMWTVCSTILCVKHCSLEYLHFPLLNVFYSRLLHSHLFWYFILIALRTLRFLHAPTMFAPAFLFEHAIKMKIHYKNRSRRNSVEKMMYWNWENETKKETEIMRVRCHHCTIIYSFHADCCMSFEILNVKRNHQLTHISLFHFEYTLRWIQSCLDSVDKIHMQMTRLSNRNE